MPAFPLMAGALASALIFVGDSLWQCCAALILLALAMAASWGNLRRGLFFISLGLAGAGVSALVLKPADLPVSHDGMRFEGTVESVAEGRAGLRAVVEVANVDFRQSRGLRCRLVTDQAVSLSPGDIVEFCGEPEPTGKYSAVPFMGISTLVDKADRVSATVLLASGRIKVIGYDNSLKYRLSALRDDIAGAFYSSDLSPEAASLAVATSLGTGDAMAGVRDRFRATGLSHLLCVSGFHVAIVAWLLALLLWPVKVWSGAGRIRYLLLIIGVWAFAVFTGAQPSAVRAAMMVSAFYLCRLLQRKASPYNSLVLAVGMMLAYNPYWLYSIGFQLSVAAVAGLLVFTGTFNPVAVRYNALWRFFNLFAVPLAAMVATAPVVLFWFHCLPLVSVPVNAFAALVFPVFLLMAFVAVIFSWGLAASLADRLCDLVMRLCDIAVARDGAVLDDVWLSPMAFVGLLVLVVVCGLALHVRNSRGRIALLGIATISLAVCVIPPQRAGAEAVAIGNARGSMLLVRNGRDCTMLSTHHKAPVNMSDYFAAHGIDSATVATDGYMLHGGKVLCIAAGAKMPRYRADILLVDGTYRGDLDVLIEAHNPQLVLAGANVDASKAAALEGICRRRGVELRHLAAGAVLLR